MAVYPRDRNTPGQIAKRALNDNDIQVPSGPEQGQVDARARIKQILDSYGLADLDGWAWGLITSGAGEAEIRRQIPLTEQYKARFKGLVEWNKKGLGAKTAIEYLNFEVEAAAFMRAAGLPAGFYDEPDDFANLFAGGVSLNEVNQRVVNGYQAVQAMDPLVREQARLWGATDGMLAAFFLDPDRSLPAINQAVAGAQIAAEGIRTGFGQLSLAEANRLADLGVTRDAAAQGFSTLQVNRELLDVLPGERGDNLSRDAALNAVFGNDTAAQEKLSRRQRARQAAFEGGGNFVTTSQGALGLGSAAS